MPQDFAPSRQQLAVRDWVIDEHGSLILRARAGTGKSSTLVYLLNFLQGQILLAAFNKAIVDDLIGKIGYRQGVKVSTVHGVGYGSLSKVVRTLPPDSRKVKNLAKPYYPTNQKPDKACLAATCSAISYAKQMGFGVPEPGFTEVSNTHAWEGIFEHYDLWDEMPGHIDRKELVKICQKLYQESLDLIKSKGSIDFDDMLLAPLYFKSVVAKYDWVLVDEAQDTNLVRRELLKRSLKPGGRMIAVGDDKQAIYGFAGATNDSLDIIKVEMKAAELPLSVTYRCPKMVVALANNWCDDLTAYEKNNMGVVTDISHREFLRYGFEPTDAILCRNTRPLVGIAKHLRKMGVQCVVEGVNYGGLVALASRWGEDISIALMLERLYEHTQEQRREYLAKEDEEKADRAQEKYEMVCDFSDGLDSGSPVYRLLDEMDRILNMAVDDETPILRLCTIHRSKGREWNRVFLVGRNLYQPSKYAKQAWELVQEQNLMYVAVTRAKGELIEVNVPKKEPGSAPWWEDGDTEDLTFRREFGGRFVPEGEA